MLTILVGSLLILMAVGVPIAFAIGLSAILYVLLSGGIPLDVIAQKIVGGADSLPLMAIPLFILAGSLMNTGGITRRIFDFANAIVGHIPGGLGHVNVLASIMFAGMSGSAVADAAGLGLIEYEAMSKRGFDSGFIGAVAAASSVLSPIIPPSIAAVIFAVMTNQSVGRIFIAGIVPGMVMALAMMVVVYILSVKRQYPIERRAKLAELWLRFREAFLSLLTPVIILGAIYLGVATPTEAAAIAVLYALFIGCVVYREIKLKDLARIFADAALTTALTMAIIATAAIFSWLLIYERVPAIITQAIFSVTTDPSLIMAISIVIFLILGCFMESVAIIMLAVPILYPIIVSVGIDPVHFGIMMLVALMIGLLTPPVGVCLFAVSSVVKTPVENLIKEIWPFYLALLIALLLIAYVPSITLWLPDVLGF